MVNNINRWRGEVGLPPVADEGGEQFTKVKVAGEDAVVFDFAAPAAQAAAPAAAQAPAADARRSYVAIVPKGGDVWFLKLIGPATTVTEQRANFDAFLQSLQIGDAGE
jgi:hypothetical protein